VIAEPGRLLRVLATAEAKLGGSNEILPCEKSIDELSRVMQMKLVCPYRPLVELFNLAREG
jgi:hypothetical protein